MKILSHDQCLSVAGGELSSEAEEVLVYSGLVLGVAGGFFGLLIGASNRGTPADAVMGMACGAFLGLMVIPAAVNTYSAVYLFYSMLGITGKKAPSTPPNSEVIHSFIAS